MTPPANGSRRRRLFALGLGLALLASAELGLRLLGIGGPGHRLDPFAGFSSSEPLFVSETDPDGTQMLRTRDDRVGPFRPARFSRVPPPETRRIFCLGGSSTYGFPLTEQEAFCALLGAALGRSHTEYRFEMINCGGMSYGSRRVLNVFREVAGLGADALVVYMGHNEYLERRFFAPFINEPRWRRTLRAGLNDFRLYALLRRVLDPLLSSGTGTPGDTFGVGPRRDDSRRLPRDHREDLLVKQQFGFALEEMTALSAEREVPFILVKPASNLRGWPPEASDWREDLAPEVERRRDAALATAQVQHRQGDDLGALTSVDEALSIDPEAAELSYLRGTILDGLGHNAVARQAYTEARDRDAAPIRVTSTLEDLIQETWAASGLIPADAQAALAAVSPHEIVGNEVVVDYCHPTAAGHRGIAALLHRVIQPVLWPGSAGRPLDRAALQAPTGPAGESAFGTAWQAQMLLRQGRVEPALPLFRRALELDSRLATAHEGLGRALAMSGQVAAGILELETATQLDPDAATGWNNLGRAYTLAGRLEEAVAAYDRSLATGTGTAVTRVNLAQVFVRLGRLDAAAAQIDAAIDESPALASAWVSRGEIAERRGDGRAAAEAFRAALRLSPGLAPARDGLARVRAR